MKHTTGHFRSTKVIYDPHDFLIFLAVTLGKILMVIFEVFFALICKWLEQLSVVCQ